MVQIYVEITFVPQLANAYHQMGKVAMVKLKNWKNHEVTTVVIPLEYQKEKF